MIGRARTAAAVVGGALVAAGHAGPLGAQPAPASVVAGARQLVVVVAPGWDATTGTLRRYERARAGARWRPVGGPVPVVLGRSGLAWGVGQGSIPAEGVVPDSAASGRAVPKREGDGRSPAGAFPLLHAFGFGAGAPGGAAFPTLTLTPGTVCVDDAASPLYNTVADSGAAAGAPWRSAERMREVAGYRTGIAVGYNGARTAAGPVRAVAPGGPPRAGAGSCIFLHVWDGPGRPTAGCTAMAADAARALAAWADTARRPALVQLPLGVYAARRRAWGLP